jgi:hypothetical protein
MYFIDLFIIIYYLYMSAVNVVYHYVCVLMTRHAAVCCTNIGR